MAAEAAEAREEDVVMSGGSWRLPAASSRPSRVGKTDRGLGEGRPEPGGAPLGLGLAPGPGYGRGGGGRIPARRRSAAGRPGGGTRKGALDSPPLGAPGGRAALPGLAGGAGSGASLVPPLRPLGLGRAGPSACARVRSTQAADAPSGSSCGQPRLETQVVPVRWALLV